MPRRSWHIAFLLGLGVLVNYFDRVNLSVSHESLIAAFGISNIAFGYLSSAYNWTYALCQLPVGVLLDKFGVRRVGRISTFIWSVASFCASVAPGIPSLFAARFLLGVGEAPTFPANAKAIGLWFPAAKRGFATAIFDSAAKFSSVLGVPLSGNHSAEDWMALELCSDGFDQPGLLFAVLEGLQRSGRGFVVECNGSARDCRCVARS